jgi:uncharacterized protein (TIGR00251 family)
VDDRWWRAEADGLVVSVRVTPGARRSEVVGISGGQLRIRIAAPPVEGKANLEARRFLAERFGVRRAAVSLLRGDRGRDKSFLITGLSEPPPDLLPR